ncbi:MAG: adenylate/guanylate cyclase domain-containing protein [Betaproteobacteria bacterium]|nr:MAG: adenylate/guanylate cyclase domain-containing protein [Betaproteobacteria bacterium]
MKIGADTIRTILERPLSQSEMEGLLRGLDEGEKVQLFVRMAELARRASAVADIANRVSDSLSLDVLFPRLMQVVTETLNADRSSMFLYDPETRELYSRVMQGNAMGEVRFPSSLGIAGSVFTSGEAEIITADAYSNSRFNQEVDRRTGYRTRNILCVPIRNKSREVIGVTQVLNKHTGDFDIEDQRLLEGLSQQAAAALENACLFEKVERQQREEAMLLEVISSIASEIRIGPLLARILAAATQLLDSERGALFLYDPKRNELYSHAAGGIDSAEIRFPANAGIAGECFTSGSVINILDAYKDPRFNPDIDKHTGYRTHSMLCMPIVAKGARVIGVMEILNRKVGVFGPADEKRLHAFCAEAAVSIQNAQLFEEVSTERNYNESILRSMRNAVLTLDAAGVVRKINESAVRILRRTESDLLGRTLGELFVGRNAWICQSLDTVRAEGKTDMTVDTEVFMDDAQAVSVDLTTVPLLSISDEPIGYMLMLEDITREKRLRNTMSRYMSKTVVDRLLESGEAVLGGISREVSVLFSDIRGFTTISERLGAQETVALLNEYFTDMVDIVFAHQGVLDKYMGDMIMAVFGSVLQNADDVENAVNVGNKMMAGLRVLNLRLEQRGREPIRIGVGISTGDVIAGNIGSPKRLEYTVIGNRVNIAHRLEDANKFYGTSVLICNQTRERMKDLSQLREIDLIRVRGMEMPVAIYEAIGHHDESSFPQRDDVLGAFTEGLSRYRQRNWTEARRRFGDALAANPKDGPSRMYLDRCEIFRNKPPAPDWDGVWTMQGKY